MSKFESFVKRLNVPMLYKAGIAISLSLVLLATVYGLFNGNALAYCIVYSMDKFPPHKVHCLYTRLNKFKMF